MLRLEVLPYPENELFSTPQSLVFREGFGLNYKISNPIFEGKINEASASQQFTLPAGAATNRLLLNHPERLGATPRTWYDVRLRLGHQTFASSKLHYDNFENRNYKVRVLSELAGISEELGGMKLRKFFEGYPGQASPHVIVDTSQDIYTCLEASPLFRFPRVYLPDFYGSEDVSGFDGWINDTKNSVHGGKGGLRETLTPFFRLGALLRLVLEKMGFAVSGSFFDETDLQDIVLFSTHQIDSDFTNISATQRIKIADYSKHVPDDVSVFDFLSAVREMFCLNYDFAQDEKRVEVNFRSDLLADSTEVLDWTSKVVGIVSNTPANTLYKIGYATFPGVPDKERFNSVLANPASSADLLPEQFFGVSSGEEQTIGFRAVPFRWGASGVQNVGGFGITGTSAHYPYLDESGGGKIRFLCYRGSGISGELNAATTALPLGMAGYGLNLVGPGGLIASTKVWGDWLRFLSQAKTVKLLLNLYSTDILQLKPGKQKIRIHNFDYLLSSLQFKIPTYENRASQQIACKAELMQLPF